MERLGSSPRAVQCIHDKLFIFYIDNKKRGIAIQSIYFNIIGYVVKLCHPKQDPLSFAVDDNGDIGK